MEAADIKSARRSFLEITDTGRKRPELVIGWGGAPTAPQHVFVYPAATSFGPTFIALLGLALISFRSQGLDEEVVVEEPHCTYGF